MPRKTPHPKPGTRKYGVRSHYTPQILTEALSKIRSGEMSRVAAAKHYKIPPVTLFYKLKSQHENTFGRPITLTPSEEQAFENHLLLLSDAGVPINMHDLRVVVKRYLDKNKRKIKIFKDNLPGYGWGVLFLDRHPILKERMAKDGPKKRAEANKEEIETFFNHLAQEIEFILPENIYSINELGFHDDPELKNLLFRRSSRQCAVVKNSSESYYTVIFCGNAEGELIAPHFIFKGKQIWSDWLFKAPPGSRMTLSKSGWIDAAIFEDWLETQFLPFANKTEGRKILLCDHLSAHVSPKALNLCAENNVRFICLPSAQHFLQPLDVFYFGPLRVLWKRVLNGYRLTKRGLGPLPKDVFTQLLNITLKMSESTRESDIQRGFEGSGIYPFNPATEFSKSYYKSRIERQHKIGVTFKDVVEELRLSDLKEFIGKKFALPTKDGKSILTEDLPTYGLKKEKIESDDDIPASSGAKRGSIAGPKSSKKIKVEDVVKRSASPNVYKIDDYEYSTDNEYCEIEILDWEAMAEDEFILG